MITIYLPTLAGGGAERSMLKLARGLNEKHFKVELVVASLRGQLISEIPSGVSVIDLGKDRVLKSIPALVRYLKSSHPDVVISTLEHANVAVLLAKLLARDPTRVVIREANVPSLDSNNALSFRGRLMPLFIRIFYRFAHSVVAVSHGVAHDLMSLGVSQNKIRVIYNPIVNQRMIELSHEPVVHPWFENNEVSVVLAAGRLTVQKDFTTLIKAFKHVVQSKNDARLVILGEGEERPKLEKLIQKLDLQSVVWLPGFQDNPFSFMKRAKVFVLSSQYEGLPGVLVQALALGCRIVSTDCVSGPREILREGKDGLLVPVEDEKAMGRGILRQLQNDRIPDRLTDTEYQQHIALFTDRTAINKYVVAFTEEYTW